MKVKLATPKKEAQAGAKRKGLGSDSNKEGDVSHWAHTSVSAARRWDMVSRSAQNY